MEAGDREDELATYLEGLDVDDAWELAPGMVAAGWDPVSVDASLEGVHGELKRQLARWVGLRATAGQLIGEIGMAAGRVSELVRIVKEYSYLDQAPIQDVVITSGIKDTLVLLKHKLKEVDVALDFPEDLKPVEVPGRDLNQVWTNLIDNAADAMEGGGTLTISAANESDGIRVTISDTGSGIPPETAERIFDPFFTTKEPGKGTGLGLHTVHTIMNRIGGAIDLETGENGTTFVVTLPTRA